MCCRRRGMRARACTSTAEGRGRRRRTAPSSSSRRPTSASGRSNRDIEPRPLTPADHGMRFGGLTWQNGELLAICETHDGSKVPPRSIVRIALDGSGVTAIADDSDFLAHPALSPSGRHIAWIAWNHPDMPWDRCELRVGRLEGGIVVEWTAVAGERSAALQPVWIDDDDLLYADDSTGRWNLWREHLSADLERHAIAPADADTGGPLWVLGTRWFGRLERRPHRRRPHERRRRARADRHRWHRHFAGGIRHLRGLRRGCAGHARAASRAPRRTRRAHCGRSTSTTREAAQLIHGGPSLWGSEWMPRPRAVTFEGPTGPVHAFDYPPTNPNVAAPEGEQPPYLVYVHGGPTTHRGGAASARIAYFTSRGIGVLDVNYGGSSGYGRAYRERLRGQWGVVDVQDVAAAASGLAATGAADAARLTIAGGSAGGWTVLAALVGTDAFAAGISRYGVGDARALATDTHDFEARYLDGLIGPLPAVRAAVHRAVAAVASGAVPRSAAASAGRRGPGCSPGTVRGDPERAGRARDPPRVCGLRGRGPRLPSRRERDQRARDRTRLPRRRVRLRHPGRAAARAELSEVRPRTERTPRRGAPTRERAARCRPLRGSARR